MVLKKNWFYYLSIALAILGLLYILVCGFMSLGAGQEYPYLPKGILLIGILVIWMFLVFSTNVLAKIRMSQRIKVNPNVLKYAEIIFVILILALAAGVRIWAIIKFPMKPASDYKTYYEIALLLKDGTIQKEGKGYCNYIAMFPHVMGYCYILKTLFSIVGTSVKAGLYLNVFFSVSTVFIIYRIARKIGGRTAGMIAIVLCAFWPSQVLYITMLSAEYCFTFMLFLCVLLFVSLVKDYDKNTKNAGIGIFKHLILGVLIALTAAIRPMALILLIAILISLFPQKMKLQLVHKNNISLTLRMLEKGWIRCVLIIIPYMIVSNVITTNIELVVNKTLPSASTSFGYNLLVGLNTQSKGGWNDEDAALLYASMEQTGSASQAHITCRDLAFQRIVNDPKGIFNLFIQKYELLWGNDDYGATWNIAFLDEQGNLTKERSDFLYSIRDMNDIFYMIMVFLALISLIYLLKTEGNIVYCLILLYIGTVVMHLMVESQNRYHYFVLEVFMILAGLGVEFIYKDAKNGIFNRKKQKEVQNIEKEQEQQVVEEYNKAESKIEELRMEAYSNVFDMKSALENGNVTMTVSQAYMEDDSDTNEEKAYNEAAITMQRECEESMAASERAVVIDEQELADEQKVTGEQELTGEQEVAGEQELASEQEVTDEQKLTGEQVVIGEQELTAQPDTLDEVKQDDFVMGMTTKTKEFDNKTSSDDKKYIMHDQTQFQTSIEQNIWNHQVEEQLKTNSKKLAILEMKIDAEMRIKESKSMMMEEENVSGKKKDSSKQQINQAVKRKKVNRKNILMSRTFLGTNIVVYKKDKKANK